MPLDQATPRYITYVKLEDVRPAVRNPKQHDVAMLVKSMQQYDFTKPLLIDERTQRLVAGHGAWHALVNLRAAGDPAVMMTGSR